MQRRHTETNLRSTLDDAYFKLQKDRNPDEALKVLDAYNGDHNDPSIILTKAKCQSALKESKKVIELITPLKERDFIKYPINAFQRMLQRDFYFLIIGTYLHTKTPDPVNARAAYNKIADKDHVDTRSNEIRILTAEGNILEIKKRLKSMAEKFGANHSSVIQTKNFVERKFPDQIQVSLAEKMILLKDKETRPRAVNTLLLACCRTSYEYDVLEWRQILAAILPYARTLCAKHPNNAEFASTLASLLCKGNAEQIAEGFKLYDKNDKNHPDSWSAITAHAFDLNYHGEYDAAIKLLKSITHFEKTPGLKPPTEEEKLSANNTLVNAYENKPNKTPEEQRAAMECAKKVAEHSAQGKSQKAKLIKQNIRKPTKSRGDNKIAMGLYNAAQAENRARFNSLHPGKPEIEPSIRMQKTDSDGFTTITPVAPRKSKHASTVTTLASATHATEIGAGLSLTSDDANKTAALSKKSATPAKKEITTSTHVLRSMQTHVSPLPAFALSSENGFAVLRSKRGADKVAKGTAVVRHELPARKINERLEPKTQPKKQQTQHKKKPKPSKANSDVTWQQAPTIKRKSACEQLTEGASTLLSYLSPSHLIHSFWKREAPQQKREERQLLAAKTRQRRG